ncbi:MAG: hypothetical protein PHV34_07245 [Verrucomicrobiae bacterium]|nr:hypothetical protein [Verrucomicrobiae bacterium]
MARVFSINNHLRALLAAACLLVSVQPGRSCGLSWGVPRSFFDHVDFQGHVLHVETVGSLDLGKIQAPLYVFFNSSLNIPSPYLGGGQAGSWCVPLLEAKMYQVDDNNYKLEQPDGWFRIFQIDKKNPSILHGQGGWKAEKNGPSLFVYATCDTKMVFNQGRIAQFQTKDKKLDYFYMNNRVSEIREGGTPILRVETAPMTGEVTGFLLRNNQRIAIEKIKLPSLTPGLKEESCLARVVKADGTSSSFEYGTDGQKNSTLKLNGARLLAWDAKTRRILKDAAPNGEWTYHVDAAKGMFENAAIGRKNAKGQTEFWHDDTAKGILIVQSLDGVKKTSCRFASGSLAGKFRKEEIVENGKIVKSVRNTYNEQGKRVRTTEKSQDNPTKTTSYQYSPDGRHITAICDGRLLWKEERDESGRVVYRENMGHSQIRTRYLTDGMREITIIPARFFKESPDTSADAKTNSNDSWDMERRRVLYYDARGHCVAQRDAKGRIWTYERSADGKTKTAYLDGVPHHIVQYGDDGQEEKTLYYDHHGTTLVREKRTAVGDGGREMQITSIDLLAGKQSVKTVHFDAMGGLAKPQRNSSGNN